ncbi:MAG: hypothetical protein WBF43_12870 [Methylocella sp.]
MAGLLTPMASLGAGRPFPTTAGRPGLAMKIDVAQTRGGAEWRSRAISALLQAKSVELLSSVENLIKDFEQGLDDD